MKYGYARVSPGGKSESVDAQTRQLTKAGCRKIFRDVHVSEAKTDRAQLRQLLDQLEVDDVVMVTRLDRLARSTRDLLNILATIKGKKAGFKSLGDTTRVILETSHVRPLGVKSAVVDVVGAGDLSGCHQEPIHIDYLFQSLRQIVGLYVCHHVAFACKGSRVGHGILSCF
jgi:hypothetical protein